MSYVACLLCRSASVGHLSVMYADVVCVGEEVSICHLQISVYTGGKTHKCTKTSAGGKQRGNWCPAVTLRGGGVTHGDWCSAGITVVAVVWRMLGLEKPAGLTVAAGNTHA